LLKGYQFIISSIYKEKPYYQRVKAFLNNYKPVNHGKGELDIARIKAFLKSIYVLGIANRGRFEYWKFIFWTVIKKPRLFVEAVTLAVYGYHYRTVYGLRNI
jgi:hypothetical protein